mgnify:CR=1 FL=1
MGKKFRKRSKFPPFFKRPKIKEALHSKEGNIPLNIAQEDRISFSVLRNSKQKLRKIENISYEINIEGNWEWIVRYDDHGGTGLLHRHIRISLKDESNVESTAGIKKYKNKDYELTWICNDIKRNYLIFRKKFLKNHGLDLY